MKAGRGNAEFMCYFPDAFFKRDSPKDYFWKIYSTVEFASFNKTYNDKLERMIIKCGKPEGIQISGEHKRIMQVKKEDNMKLKIALKRSGTLKNITFLKKTKKVNKVQPTTNEHIKQSQQKNQIENEEDEDEEIYSED